MQMLSNNLSLVPGQGLVPAQTVPGPGYVTGPKGLSVLSPALPDGFRATGFDTQGPWPTRVIDLNEEGDAFSRVSPLQSMINNSGGIPNVYKPDPNQAPQYGQQQPLQAQQNMMMQGQQPYQQQYQQPMQPQYPQPQQPMIPGMVPSAEQTLAQMDQYNKRVAAGMTPPPPQPGQFQGDMGQVMNQPTAPVNQFMPNGQPAYLYPQDVQRAQMQKQAQSQPNMQQIPPQRNYGPQQYQQQAPEIQPLGQSVEAAPGLNESVENALVISDRKGNQMFGNVEAILLDDSDVCVTMTLVNPDSQVENLIRAVPLDESLVISFDGRAVTNLAMAPGQTQLPVKNTRMIVNNTRVGQKFIILAVDQ